MKTTRRGLFGLMAGLGAAAVIAPKKAQSSPKSALYTVPEGKKIQITGVDSDGVSKTEFIYINKMTVVSG